MRFSCIFVITFWCSLYISVKSSSENDESFANQPIVETSTVTIEKSSEIDISDMLQRMVKKFISSDDMDMMQRKGKNQKPIKVEAKLEIYLSEKEEKEKECDCRKRNCLDLKKQGNTISGTYLITPCDNTTKSLEVYCDMDTDGGGWTVIQRRDNYPVQQLFNNSWSEYAVGFGNVSRDFWIGNDNIHFLTKQTHNELRFDMEEWSGNKTFAKYGGFYIADQANRYKLYVQNYSGNAGGDAFQYYHNGLLFSTYDRDHDYWSGNCAKSLNGFWHRKCAWANMNARNGSVYWYTGQGTALRLKRTEMKIRPKS